MKEGVSMLNAKITRRILGSFLLLSLTGLILFGIMLMTYFHDETIQKEEHDLMVQAQVIELTLRQDIYERPGELVSKIDEINAQTGLRVTVIDDNGRVLADSNRDAETMDNHWGRPEVQQALSQPYGSATRYSHTLDQNMLYVAVPIHNGGLSAGIIRTATSLQPIEDAMHHTLMALVGALIVTFIASILLAIWLAHRQLRPIFSIISTARDIMNGDLSSRVTCRTGDEFDILIRTLNQLTSRLKEKIDESRIENEKLNLILETMDNGVVLFDENGNITAANRRVRTLLDLHKEDLYHHSIHIFGDTTLSETAMDVMKDGKPRKIQLSLPLQGSIHTFRIYFATFTAANGPAVLAVLHDVSLMEAIWQRQHEFIGNAAHELRTPLTSIRGFAELLSDDDFSDPAVSHHCADVIEKESARMDRLISELLDLAHIDEDDFKKHIVLEPVDVGHVLKETARELSPSAALKGQTIAVDISSSSKLSASEDLLGQIIRNLTENAIKYTPEGGHIHLASSEDDESIFITVKDDGIGIDAEHIPYIFDRFYRVDKARSRASGGNGIGLSIVKSLVTLFSGKITVSSTPGEGTTFHLSFPKLQDGT